jgi:hypothetical protein
MHRGRHTIQIMCYTDSISDTWWWHAHWESFPSPFAHLTIPAFSAIVTTSARKPLQVDLKPKVASAQVSLHLSVRCRCPGHASAELSSLARPWPRQDTLTSTVHGRLCIMW